MTLAGDGNPYVGPRAFLTGEQLYGRDNDLHRLLDLFLAERMVLFYSPSGAGKTSLIQAALIPALREEGFVVLPTIRVGAPPPPVAQGGTMRNRYLASALGSMEKSRTAPDALSTGELASADLSGYLERRLASDGESPLHVLIFDQFEEVLTGDPTDQDAKAAWFAEIGTALKERRRWALFSMREDYIAGLDPYLHFLPNRLTATYRLGLLERDEARKSIQEPASRLGVTFDDDAASALLADLGRVRIQLPDGSSQDKDGPFIEPLHLQVVCRRLWQREVIQKGGREITALEVAAAGDVDAALVDYYEDALADVLADPNVQSEQVSEASLRRWFEEQLVTKQGIRGQVLLEGSTVGGLAAVAVERLVSRYLVRKEDRRGAIWFELTHDRLIPPIQRSNATWFKTNSGPLQVQASAWGETASRNDAYLFTGVALAEAQRWADGHDDLLSDLDREFLAESHAAEDEQLKAEQLLQLEAATVIAAREAALRHKAEQRLRLGIAFAALAGVLAVAALIGATYAWGQRNDARSANDKADVAASAVVIAQDEVSVAQTQAAQRDVEVTAAAATFAAEEENSVAAAVETVRARSDAADRSRKLAEQSASQLTVSPDLGLLLAAAAYDESDKAIEPRANLVRALVASPRMIGFLPDAPDEVRSLAVSTNGKMLAIGTCKARNPRGNCLVGLIELLDPTTGKEIAAPIEPPYWPEVIAISPDGTLVAIVGESSWLLWDIEGGREIETPDVGGVGVVSFSPDGSTLALGTKDGRIVLWDIAGGTPNLASRIEATPWPGGAAIEQLVFSPDGRVLASGDGTGRVALWSVASNDPDLVWSKQEAGSINALGFSADGSRLAAASDTSTGTAGEAGSPSILIFAPESGDEIARLGSQTETLSLGFVDNATLLTGQRDGLLTVWDLTTRKSLEHLSGHSRDVVALAGYTEVDGHHRFITGGIDKAVISWDLSAPRSLGTFLEGQEGIVTGLAFGPEASPVAPFVISGGEDNRVITWTDPSSYPPAVAEFDVPVVSLALDPGGARIALGTDDGVFLWDLDSPEPDTALPGMSGEVTSVAFSPDGTWVAGGSTERAIVIWDTATGNQRTSFTIAGTGQVDGMAFRTDGTLLVGTNDGKLTMWNLDGVEAGPGVETQNPGAVSTVAFSEDRSIAAFGHTGGDIELIDLTARKTIGTLAGTGTPINSLAIARGSAWIASAGQDGSIVLWAVDGGEGHGTTIGVHPGGANAVVFSSDGRRLASGGKDRQVVVWNVDPESWRDEVCRMAGRQLTTEEWQEYLGDEEERELCSRVTGPYPAGTASPASGMQSGALTMSTSTVATPASTPVAARLREGDE